MQKTVVVVSQMLENNNPGCIWHFTLVVRKIYLHRRVVLFTSWTHRKKFTLTSIYWRQKNRRVRKIVVRSQMLKNNMAGYSQHFVLVVRKRYLHRRVAVFTSWTHRTKFTLTSIYWRQKNRRVRKIVVRSQMLKNNMAGYSQHFVLVVRKRYLHSSHVVLTLWTHGVASASTSIYRWQEESACRKDS